MMEWTLSFIFVIRMTTHNDMTNFWMSVSFDNFTIDNNTATDTCSNS